MNAKRFRKVFLPSVILLFSTLIVRQPGWACDTPETPDGQCYEQLDIKSVHVDGSSMHILGKHFKNGNFPEVTLGGIGFPVDWHSDEEIVAIFPALFEPGHYKLEVSTGDGHKCKDKQSVTLHHREEPPPPPPPTCQPCPEQCPQGPPGPQGPAGTCTCQTPTLDTKIVPADKTTFKNDYGDVWSGTAYCTSLSPDYSVTGGGFSFQETEQVKVTVVMESRPLEDRTGWHLVLALAGPADISISILDLPSVTVWAVCAKIVQQSP